ncbi:MAG: PspC domain-containing protein [Thermotogae bacterium]|nr:PspC domain-containing protein [Thermotogota bacterium]
MAIKKLYRSRRDKVIGGVCGGLGEYLGVDPVLLRIIFLASIFLGGAGLILYIIAWIIIPNEPLQNVNETENFDVVEGEEVSNKTKEIENKLDGRLILAGILIIVGVLLLLANAFPLIFSWAFSFKTVFGVLLVIIGGILMINFFKENVKK